jgi:prepilin-type N-terminal cleavage/methylation domain-containing protein
MKTSIETTPRSGFSLIEVLVAMTLLAFVMLGIAGAASHGLAQMGKARQDLQYSADVQQVADSLVSVGWNNVTSGSSSIRGRSVSWTATTLSPTSQQVSLVVSRRGQANTTLVYSDTLMLYLARPRVQ